MRKFFILFLCFLLLLSLTAPCLAFFAEAAGMMGAAGAMGYYGVGATSSAFGTDTFNSDFDDFGIGISQELDNPMVRYNADKGTVSYDASTLNAYGAYYQNKFANALFWRPPLLNVTTDYDFDWAGYLCSVDMNSAPPLVVGNGSSNVTGQTVLIKSKTIPLDDLPVGTSIYIDDAKAQAVTSSSMSNFTAATVKASAYNVNSYGLGVRGVKSDNSVVELSPDENGIFHIASRSGVVGWQVYFAVYCKMRPTGAKPSANPVPLINAVNLRSVVASNDAFAGSGSDEDVETNFTISDSSVFENKAISDATDKIVDVAYLDEDGNNILFGVPVEQVGQVLRDALFSGRVASVTTAESEGALSDGNDDVVGGIFGLVQSIKNYIAELLRSFPVWFSNVKEAVIEAIQNATPHFGGIELPPGLIPSGGNGFGFGGIWHYVKSWLGSMASGIGLFFSQVYANIPSALVIPIYATAVIVIVVGLFKRYIH